MADSTSRDSELTQKCECTEQSYYKWQLMNVSETCLAKLGVVDCLVSWLSWNVPPGKGIVAEHNHVDYSNNMWRWMFVDNVVEGNRDGGLQIELPMILDPYSNGNHSIDVNNSRCVAWIYYWMIDVKLCNWTKADMQLCLIDNTRQ